jgi:hypothetical protein
MLLVVYPLIKIHDLAGHRCNTACNLIKPGLTISRPGALELHRDLLRVGIVAQSERPMGEPVPVSFQARDGAD